MVSTATAHEGMDPQPRTEIVIDPADLDPATVKVTVLQLSRWGTITVRGAEKRAVAGGFAVTDYEIPPGVPVTYRVEQFAADGASLGFALNMSAEVSIPVGWVVVADPLVPGNAVQVRAELSFAERLTRSRPTQMYQAGLQTIALSGQMSLLQEVTLRCVTESDADREMLAAIVAESAIVVRSMPPMRLPGSFYAVAPDVPMVPFDARAGGATDVWDLVGHEISRPMLEIVIPTYTWQHVIDYYPTWDALLADRATWLDVIRNPPPGV